MVRKRLLTLLIFFGNPHRVPTSGLASHGQGSRDGLKRKGLVRSCSSIHGCGLLEPEVIDVLVQLRIDLASRGSIVMTI